jgi:hypothetical protein
MTVSEQSNKHSLDDGFVTNDRGIHRIGDLMNGVSRCHRDYSAEETSPFSRDTADVVSRIEKEQFSTSQFRGGLSVWS